MTPLLAVVIGVLYAAAVYMLLRRSIAKLIIGLALLSHAVNLLIFTAGKAQESRPPVLFEPSMTASLANTADPLPQALILTAIVINFGLVAFVVTLLHRSAQSTGNDDLEQLREPER